MALPPIPLAFMIYYFVSKYTNKIIVLSLVTGPSKNKSENDKMYTADIVMLSITQGGVCLLSLFWNIIALNFELFFLGWSWILILILPQEPSTISANNDHHPPPPVERWTLSRNIKHHGSIYRLKKKFDCLLSHS